MAAILQLLWLVARCEAWHVCVRGAGGVVKRRRLYRAGSVGYLGSIFNGQFGLAVRIAALRRSAPEESPPAPALLAAEVPIIVVEAALAALMSFTLVGPLGLPWWLPVALLLAGALGLTALTKLAGSRRNGVFRGLGAMRGIASRRRIIALVVVAVVAQGARNWLVLKGLGVDASVFDAIALLIATAALGILPIGPGLGALAAILILGAHGAAAAAAAGALLTATGAVGAICFAIWALVDMARRTDRRDAVPAPA